MNNWSENFRVYIRVFLIALVLSMAFFWIRDILGGEKARVRKFILQGKNAVESKDIFSCANMISFSYEDKYGTDRQSLIYAAKEFFNYYQRIFINLESMDIKLNDAKNQANVELVALMIGQTQDNNTDRILEGEKGRFRIRLIKEEKKWKLIEIEFFEPIRIMGQNIS